MKVFAQTSASFGVSVCLLILVSFTAANAAPALLSPAAGSTLPGSTVTFTWTADGTTPTDWSLRIGTSQGDASLYNSGDVSSGTLAQTVSGIPTDGTPVWVRLQWRYPDGTLSNTDAQFTAGSTSPATNISDSNSSTSNDGSGIPALLSPAPDSTLAGSTITFTWTGNGATPTDWSLRIGTSQGDAWLYNSGNLSSGTLAQTVSGIPTNGTPVWVRLQWRSPDGSWSHTDSQFPTGQSSDDNF